MQCDLHTLTKLSPTHHSRQHQSFTLHNNAFERSNLASMQETFAPGPTLVHAHFAVVQRCEDNPYSCLTNKWLQFGLSRAAQPRCGREPHTPSTYARAAITLSSVPVVLFDSRPSVRPSTLLPAQWARHSELRPSGAQGQSEDITRQEASSLQPWLVSTPRRLVAIAKASRRFRLGTELVFQRLGLDTCTV